eukprot:2918289-Rhodomonas_salina.2
MLCWYKLYGDCGLLQLISEGRYLAEREGVEDEPGERRATADTAKSNGKTRIPGTVCTERVVFLYLIWAWQHVVSA